METVDKLKEFTVRHTIIQLVSVVPAKELPKLLEYARELTNQRNIDVPPENTEPTVQPPSLATITEKLHVEEAAPVLNHSTEQIIIESSKSDMEVITPF
jgi:hypothetical protein